MGAIQRVVIGSAPATHCAHFGEAPRAGAGFYPSFTWPPFTSRPLAVP
jgi:hypothetical protein